MRLPWTSGWSSAMTMRIGACASLIRLRSEPGSGSDRAFLPARRHAASSTSKAGKAVKSPSFGRSLTLFPRYARRQPDLNTTRPAGPVRRWHELRNRPTSRPRHAATQSDPERPRIPRSNARPRPRRADVVKTAGRPDRGSTSWSPSAQAARPGAFGMPTQTPERPDGRNLRRLDPTIYPLPRAVIEAVRAAGLTKRATCHSLRSVSTWYPPFKDCQISTAIALVRRRGVGVCGRDARPGCGLVPLAVASRCA